MKAVIISPDEELAIRLERALTETGRVQVVRKAAAYLHGAELERFLLAHVPQVVFIDPKDMFAAVETVREAQSIIKGIKVAAASRTALPDVLVDLMRIGVREFLLLPFQPETVESCLNRLDELLANDPASFQSSDAVYTFLPSKAGVGASTVALNTAVALAQVSKERVLLADLDLNNGMLGFMLKMDSGYTIYEAAAHASNLDRDKWDQLVARSTVDLLPSGRLDPGSRLETSQLRELISFARRFYQSICLDLSGNMEKFSLDMLLESKRIFLVVTPEIPSIHMAQSKITLLRAMELLDRVEVLVNRSQKNQDLGTGQISKLLDVPVRFDFPNCYREVHRALTLGLPIEASSAAGKKFRAFATHLLGSSGPAKPHAPQKKFLEFFNVTRHKKQFGDRQLP